MTPTSKLPVATGRPTTGSRAMPSDSRPPSTSVMPLESNNRTPITVSWDDVVRFIRQLSHDLRNHLNAAELQAAYLSEIATDAEMKEEIKRLREMVSVLGTTLQ